MTFRVAANTAAIYADQLGDFDWRLENIGLIDKSFVLADSLIVSTTAGILASLDAQTGRLKWRVVLPEHSTVEKFIMVGGDQIATLMSYSLPANETNLSMIIRSWLLSNGGLLWDVTIGSSFEAGVSPLGTPLDALYDASRKRLVILFANSLHFITPPPIQVFPKHNMQIGGTKYWRWSATADLEKLEDKQQQQQLVLSSLIIPSKRVDSQKDGPMRIAIGCLVDEGSSSHCNGIGAILLLEMTNSSVEAEFHVATFALQHADLSINPSTLRALVSSDASSVYLTTDVVFGVVVDGNAAVHLLIQPLHVSKHMEVLQLPIRKDAVIESAGSFVYRTEENQFVPAAYGCSPASHCSSFLAVRSGTDDQWLLLSLLDGMAECVGLVSDPTRVFSAIQFQASPHSISLVRGVHSVRIGVSFQSQQQEQQLLHPYRSSKAIISEIMIASVGSKGPIQARLAPLSLLLPPQADSISPILHSTVMPLHTHNSSECRYRLLLVLRSGTTVMLSNPCTTDFLDSRPTIDWYRMEALSSLRQAVLVGRPQQLMVREGAVPNWRQRLHLQGLELQVCTPFRDEMTCGADVMFPVGVSRVFLSLCEQLLQCSPQHAQHYIVTKYDQRR